MIIALYFYVPYKFHSPILTGLFCSIRGVWDTPSVTTLSHQHNVEFNVSEVSLKWDKELRTSLNLFSY